MILKSPSDQPRCEPLLKGYLFYFRLCSFVQILCSSRDVINQMTIMPATISTGASKTSAKILAVATTKGTV